MSTFTETRSESITLRGPSTAQPIIVALDGSALSARALPIGVHLARQRQSPLILVRVAPLDPPPDMFGFAVGDFSRERDFAGAYVERLVQRTHKENPDVQVRGEVLSGGASRGLLEAQAEHSPQLTIITSHGRTGLSRMFRGSVTEDILRGSHSTTLVLWPWSLPDDASLGPDHPSSIRNEPVTLGRTILVPLDGSARTARILPEAFRMARDADGQIILTTVLDLASTTVHRARDLEHAIFRALEDRAKVIRDAGVPTKVDVIVSADVAGSLVTHASSSRADLIAMTTHARGSIGKFVFGSVANRVASRASRPVLFTPPFDGEVSYDALYPDVPASVLNLASLPHDVSHP